MKISVVNIHKNQNEICEKKQTQYVALIGSRLTKPSFVEKLLSEIQLIVFNFNLFNTSPIYIFDVARCFQIKRNPKFSGRYYHH